MVQSRSDKIVDFIIRRSHPFPANSVFPSVLFFKWISRIGGIHSFSLPENVHGKVQIKWYNYLQWITWLTINILCFYSNLTVHLNLSRSSSLLVAYGTKLVVVASIFLGFLFKIQDNYNRNRLWDIVMSFYAFDEAIRKYGCPIDSRKETKAVFNMIITSMYYAGSLMIVSFGFWLGSNHLFVHLNIYSAGYFVFTVSYMCSMNAYFFMLIGCGKRFGVLNNILKASFGLDKHDEISTPIVGIAKSTMKDVVSEIAILHDGLNDLVEMINQCFAIQVMMYFGMSFCYCIVAFYTVYTVFTKVKENIVLATVISVSWSIFYFSYVFIVIVGATLMYNEGSKTSKILYEIINTCDCSFLMDSIEVFLKQLEHREPIATCGFFNFDGRLLFTMIGSATSYLMIMIQFNQ